MPDHRPLAPADRQAFGQAGEHDVPVRLAIVLARALDARHGAARDEAVAMAAAKAIAELLF